MIDQVRSADQALDLSAPGDVIPFAHLLHRKFAQQTTLAGPDPCVVFWFDREGRYQKILHKPNAYLRSCPNEMVGLPVWKVHAKRNSELFMDYIERCLSGGVMECINPIITSHLGVKFQSECQGYRLDKNQILYVVRNQTVLKKEA